MSLCEQFPQVRHNYNTRHSKKQYQKLYDALGDWAIENGHSHELKYPIGRMFP